MKDTQYSFHSKTFKQRCEVFVFLASSINTKLQVRTQGLGEELVEYRAREGKIRFVNDSHVTSPYVTFSNGFDNFESLLKEADCIIQENKCFVLEHRLGVR